MPHQCPAFAPQPPEHTSNVLNAHSGCLLIQRSFAMPLALRGVPDACHLPSAASTGLIVRGVHFIKASN